MPLPKKNRDWAQELNAVWDEAEAIFHENAGTADQRRLLYRMAPTLALYQRQLENSKEQGEIVAKALASTQFLHHQAPAMADNIKRAFAITYLQTHVHARLLSSKQASDLICYLERKGVIEPDKVDPQQLH